MDTNPNKLVLLHWIGRFGNRMFQYAFGCSYAKRYNCIFYIPSEWEGSIIFKPNDYCRVITDELLSTDINNPSATDEMRENSLANYNDRTGDAVEYVSFQNKHAVGKVNVAFADLHCMYYLFDIFDEALIKEIYTFNDAVLQSEMYQWFYANKNAAQTVCHLRRGDIAELNFIGSHSMISKESYLKQLDMLGIGALDVIWISESKQERSDNVWNDKSRGHNWSYPKGESYCPEIFLDFLPDFLSMVFAKTLLRGNSSLSWWAAFLSSAEIYSPVINPKPHDKYYCCDCEFVKGNAPHFMGSKLDSDAFNDIIIPTKNDHHAFESCYLKYAKCINIQPQSQKKIISFSLYGTTSQYSNSRGFYKGIYVNYHLAKKLYPGWIVRVYMPSNEPAHIINELSQFTDIELILVETNICLRALRFLPHDDENVSVWLSRDLDSILNEREQVAVSDWLTNYPTKELHIMTDNVQHYWTIAGGMFGIRNDVKRASSSSSSSLIDFIMKFSNKVSDNNNYATDCDICEQFFFKDDNYIQHYGSGKALENSKPFPPHSPMDCNFVGDIVDIHAIYSKLNTTPNHPGLRNKKTMTLENNDVFYYLPWNSNCVVNWWNETDFTLTPIQTDKSTTIANSCLKTENGMGVKMLTSGDMTIPVLWEDGQEQKHIYISDENTIAVIHGIEHHYFTRVHQIKPSASIQMSDALYWTQLNCDPISKYVPNDKYIIVTPWPGGMSNVRLSFELSCALAYCTNRALVVPDLCYIDHLPANAHNRMHDLRLFFDFNDLGISVMTLSDFCNKENIAESDATELNKSCTVYNVTNFDTCHNYINVSNPNQNPNPNPNPDPNPVLPKCFSNRTEIILSNDSKYVHFDKCLLGSFYSMLRHSNQHDANRVKLYVHKHVHYRSEIFEAAMKVVSWLKRERCDGADGEYYAMHARRGDFMHCDYKTTCIPIEDVMKNIEPHIVNPMNACIYIATDSVDLSEFNALQLKYNVITFRDVLNEDIMEINPVFHGIVEQIICAHGTKFFSHPLSTFSNYVHRLRGYMPGVSDKFCYQTTTTEQMLMTIDSDWACASNVWSKEFVDGFLMPE